MTKIIMIRKPQLEIEDNKRGEGEEKEEEK